MSEMRRLRALVVSLLLGAGPSACSLLVSTDGLSGAPAIEGGAGAGDASLESAADSSPAQDAAGAADAADAAKTPPSCDLTKPFGTMTLLAAPVSSPSNELAGYFSPDRLTIYVASDRSGAGDIFAFSRPNVMAPWGIAIAFGAVNSAQKDSDPWVSADQLTMYLDSKRPASAAGANVFVATRAKAGDDFGAAVLVGGGVASDSDDREPWLTPSRDRLYFASDRDATSLGVGLELYVSQRAGDGTFGAALRLAELGSGATEESPFLTADELTVYFASERSGGPGASDIWTAKRSDKDAAFGAPVVVAELSTTAADYPSWLSDDGCAILIESYITGNAELFYSERPK